MLQVEHLFGLPRRQAAREVDEPAALGELPQHRRGRLPEQRRQPLRRRERFLDQVRRGRDVLRRLGHRQVDALAIGDRAALRRAPFRRSAAGCAPPREGAPPFRRPGTACDPPPAPADREQRPKIRPIAALDAATAIPPRERPARHRPAQRHPVPGRPPVGRSPSPPARPRPRRGGSDVPEELCAPLETEAAGEAGAALEEPDVDSLAAELVFAAGVPDSPAEVALAAEDSCEVDLRRACAGAQRRRRRQSRPGPSRHRGSAPRSAERAPCRAGGARLDRGRSRPSSEFSMLSAAFSRCSSRLVLERAPDVAVQLAAARAAASRSRSARTRPARSTCDRINGRAA